MNASITTRCLQCHQYTTIDPAVTKNITCSKCQKQLGTIKEGEYFLEHCPICDCRQFYLMKDFNQMLGCGVMLIGIILVPFTYGLSLPVFALIDWLIYRKYPQIIVCYRCACEFRGFPEKEKTLKPFMHHIGLKYDKYR